MTNSRAEYHKKWHQLNKEKNKEKAAEYYQLNKEKIRERILEYNQLNKEKKREYDKKYKELNKKKIREQKREYCKEKRAYCIEYLGGKCVVCGTTHNLQFDHIKRETKKYTIGSRIHQDFTIPVINIRSRIW